MRTSQDTYWPGVRENIRWTTGSGMPWQWRRIVFMFKGSDIAGVENNNPSDSALFRQISGSTDPLRNGGMVRLVTPIPTSVELSLVDLVFKGTEGIDWPNPLVAAVDKRRVDVTYDKCRILRSNNDFGNSGKLKLWHPIRGNILYGGDENEMCGYLHRFQMRSKEAKGICTLWTYFSRLDRVQRVQTIWRLISMLRRIGMSDN